jgi:hypothetical protein
LSAVSNILERMDKFVDFLMQDETVLSPFNRFSCVQIIFI